LPGAAGRTSLAPGCGRKQTDRRSAECLGWHRAAAL